MDPPSLGVDQSQQSVVKLNLLRDLTGGEVSDLFGDSPGNVVRHTEGEDRGQTSEAKQSQHHSYHLCLPRPAGHS